MGFCGHIQIGNNVWIGTQSGIIGNVLDGQNIMGSPAIEVNRFLRTKVIFPRLPERYRQVGRLQKK